jgi:hypothetical protein
VHHGHGGVGGRALLREQHGEGPPERGAAAEDHHLASGDWYLVVRQQRLDARRRAGQRAGQADGQAAHVERVHAVDVLVRVDALQRRVVVQVGRDGVLHEQPVHGRVRVEAADGLSEVGLGGSGGQVLVRRREAELGGLAPRRRLPDG